MGCEKPAPHPPRRSAPPAAAHPLQRPASPDAPPDVPPAAPLPPVAPPPVGSASDVGAPLSLPAADHRVREDLARVRRYILGDGLRPDVDGDYGCSGTGATRCVETTWLDLAGAVAAFAGARCGAAPAAPALAAYERARARQEMEAMTFSAAALLGAPRGAHRSEAPRGQGEGAGRQRAHRRAGGRRAARLWGGAAPRGLRGLAADARHRRHPTLAEPPLTRAARQRDRLCQDATRRTPR